ncbi:E3 ubiquitin-protein ligase RNF146-like isoform X1 [Tachypleus tridentatus]|uniref:E3 ubiquitin-protein ligase RNF146-like isoform X1 n=1 Tax=Tachypleus tridentatus TaxID=6853 RepID=UPI003FD6327F
MADKIIHEVGSQETTDDTVNERDTPKDKPDSCEDSSVDQKVEMFECAICLQSCIHPVKLPCQHIFCFLCVKGVANQSKRCAMCRQEIPPSFLETPTLLSVQDLENELVFEDGYQWFYEGRNGWWQFDSRTSVDLETAFKGGETRCEVLIAGFLYIVDFEHMIQMRHSDPSRRRRIKRDFSTIPKKGIAGIRLPVERTDEEVAETSVTVENASDFHISWAEVAAEVSAVALVRSQQRQADRRPKNTSIPTTPTNTPQTPGLSPGNQSSENSVPSSPGRSDQDGNLEHSLAEAIHNLRVNTTTSAGQNQPTVIVTSQRNPRPAVVRPHRTLSEGTLTENLTEGETL